MSVRAIALGDFFEMACSAMQIAPPGICSLPQKQYTGSNLLVTVQLPTWESEMKKLVPFVFIAIMASLIGAKFSIAGEQPTATPVAQVQLTN